MKFKWLKIINISIMIVNLLYLIYFISIFIGVINNVTVFGIGFLIVSVVTILIDISLIIADIVLSKR